MSKRYHRILSVFLSLLLAVGILSFVLPEISGVQGILGKSIGGALSNKLGTEVRVGKVEIRFPNGLSIRDFLLFDQQGDTLVYCKSADTQVEIIPLLIGKGININTLRLLSPDIRLNRSKDGKTNFQFVIDSISSEESDSGTMPLRLDAFALYDAKVCYEDAGHQFHATGLNTDIAVNHLLGDTLDAGVREMTADVTYNNHDISLRGFSSSIKKTGERIEAKNLSLQIAESTVNIERLTYNTGSSQWSANIKPSTFTKEDMLDLGLGILDSENSKVTTQKSQLKSIPFRHITLSGIVAGNDHSWHISDMLLHTDNDNIHLALNRLSITKDGQHLKCNVKKARFAENTISSITDALNISLSASGIEHLTYVGDIDKEHDNISVRGILSSGIGDVTIKGRYVEDVVDASFVTDGLRLQQLTAMSPIDDVAGELKVNGNIITRTLKLSSSITHVKYAGESYNNIKCDADIDGSLISGRVTVDDTGCQLSAEGRTDLKQKTLVFSGDIKHFIYNGTTIDGKIDADVSFAGNEVLDGSITIRNSDLQARIEGVFGYTPIYSDIVSCLKQRLPSLQNLPAVRRTPDANYHFNVLVNDIDKLQKILHLPIDIKGETSINGEVNASENTLRAQVSCKDMKYDGNELRDIIISLSDSGNTLKSDIEAVKVQTGDETYQICVNASSTADLLKTRISWDSNIHSGFCGELNTETTFSPAITKSPNISVKVMPSHISVNDSVFNITSGAINYRNQSISATNTVIERGNQHIIIDGTASDRSEDTLSVTLQNIDVEQIQNIVDFHSVDFCGKASGKAFITSAFKEASAMARLTVRDFEFEYGNLGTLNVEARWNNTEKQIDILGGCDDNKGTLDIAGFVSPSQKSIDLRLGLHQTPINFLNTFTAGVLEHIDGRSDGTLNVIGPLKRIQLLGAVKAKATFEVPVLNTSYSMHGEDTVYFVPDDIIFRNIHVYDTYDNTAVVNGGVHHQHLGRFTFDMGIDTERFLCYNSHEFGSNSFYGTIFAGGTTNIHNIRGETDITGTMTPLDGSSFVYNASRENYINTHKFVTMRDGQKLKTQDIEPTQNPITRKKVSSNLYVDFTLNTNQDMRLGVLMDSHSNDFINLYGDGQLQAKYYNKGGMDIYGTYTIDHGSYDITLQELIKKNFTFEKGGTIIFTGDAYDARLNLQATHTVNNVSLSDLNIGNSFSNNTIRVNCIMDIGGTPNNPLIGFDLDMPNVNTDEKQMIRSIINSEEDMNQQVVYLLGIGRFYTKTANNEEANQGGRSQTQLAMQSLLSGSISSQLSNMLSKIISDDKWNVGANISTGDEGWMNAQYEGTVSGRLFDNRLLVNGQFGYRDNQTNANPSFIGDFDIQYLLTPSGNLSIKAYNQTNDRYFTKSSLNTQGLGLIIKKDFNQFRDLFIRKKKKIGK